MRVGIVGSRGLAVTDLDKYLPPETTEIVSGGCKNSVDIVARAYALEHGIKLTEFLPEYDKYRKGAPLKRNLEIITNSDVVLAFYDGRSRGTQFVINNCNKMKISVKVYLSNDI
jgi:hypothetical protein